VENPDVGNLPTPLTSFVGRRSEIQTLRRLVSTNRLVTVLGPGGCGKTRLALEAAQRLRNSFQDGVWWIDLAALSPESSLPAAVSDALHISVQPRKGHTRTIIQSLREQHALLVFDNCEHKLDQCAEMIEMLLSECSNVKMIATSREPVGAQSETTWRIQPLAVASTSAEPSEIQRCDAVRLFVDRARSASPSFKADSSNVNIIGRICSRLDGIPLPIELASAQVAALSLEQMLKALEEGVGLLEVDKRSRQPRHRTLRASMDWSYQLLGSDEQAVLRRLSVFPESFSLDAAKHICGAGTISPDSVLALLASLVHKSLVTVVESGENRRYRLLEVVRQYATEKLSKAGEAAETHNRLISYALSMIDGFSQLLFYQSSPSEWVEVTLAELHIFRTALEWGISHPSGDGALRLANSLAHFYANSDNPSEGQQLMEDVIAASGREPSPILVTVMWCTSIIALMAGNSSQARRFSQEALAMAEQIGEPTLKARALTVLGSVEASLNPEHAREYAEQGLDIAERCGDEWARVHAIVLLLVSHSSQGRIELVRSSAPEADDLIERLGVTGSIASWYWLALSLTAVRRGEFAQAILAAQRAEAEGVRVGDRTAPAWAKLWAASAARALALVGNEPSRLAEKPAPTQQPPYLAALSNLASARHALAECAADEAEPFLLAATELSRESGLATVEGECCLDLAELRLERGSLAEARTLLESALNFASAIQSRWLQAGATALLARLARAESHRDEAIRLGLQAATMQARHGYVFEATKTLADIAEWYAEDGAKRDAARVYGAVGAACERLGIGRPNNILNHGDVGQFGDSPELVESRKEGAALTIEEIVVNLTRRRASGVGATGWGSLTSRELTVVRLVAEGRTNNQIADRLAVSLSTVKVHLSHIYEKLKVCNRVELAREAGRRFDAG
jgi:predicted ATPase/DNA-binding CsgD family transcriptional regulator